MVWHVIVATLAAVVAFSSVLLQILRVATPAAVCVESECAEKAKFQILRGNCALTAAVEQ